MDLYFNGKEMGSSCEFCDKHNTEENLIGDEGIVEKGNKVYLFIAHFKNETYRIDASYCPRCGRYLKNE